VDRAEIVEPIVVGTSNGARQLRLHAVDPLREEPARGIDDADVDAFRVHRVELGLGAPSAVVEGPEALPAPLTAVPARSPRIGDAAGHELAVDLDAQVEHPLHESARGLVLEGRVDVPLPEIGRLDDVDVAVEDAEARLGHGWSLLHRAGPIGASPGRLDSA